MGIFELAASPLPVVLAIFGGIAMLLAMIGSVEGNIIIRITPGRQRVLFATGIVFLVAGLSLYLIPRNSSPEPTPSSAAPTATPNLSTLTPVLTPTEENLATETPSVPLTDTLTPPMVEVLFADDFDTSLKSEWQWDVNYWRVLDQRAHNVNCGVISVGSQGWNDYALSFSFELPTDTDGNVQVLFAAQDQQNSWVAALLTEGENGAVSLLKRTDDGVQWPSGITTQRSNVFRANEANHFHLQVQGSTVRLSIGGQEVYNVDLRDDLSGAIGIRACPKSLSWIDDLEVVALSE